MRARRNDEVHRITDADPHTADLNARINRYLISMAIRTLCVILAIVVPSPWRWFFVVGAIGLPYIAVVLANNRTGSRAGLPVFDPGADRTALPPAGPGDGPPPQPNG